MEQANRFKSILAFLAVSFFAFIAFGMIWFFFLGPENPVGLGWYFFSFAAGLTMIVLPCTLPLAFVIVPLSMGKGAVKGFGIALAFGLGIAITLSMYGILAAVLGEVAIGSLGAPLEVVKNWLYLIAGIFAYLFALGEIGLVNFRMPSYTGAAPAFIQKRQDYLKALLLGLFLGNVGVGCPHPATPVILTRIAASGDVFYGWMLFFVHAIGRVLPLLFLALLAILGINALSWLIARKDKIERATGWGMVFIAGFILVLGLFSHDWWVYSGQHTLLEEVTQEKRFLGIIVNRFNFAEPPHTHGIPTGAGLFGLPLWLGNWVLVFLWILPMWWNYIKKSNIKHQKLKMTDEEFKIEERVMPYRFWFYTTVSLLLAITFIWVLPDRFLNHRTEAHAEKMPRMMNEVDHGAGGFELYHEENEVHKGLAVNFNTSPYPVTTGTSTDLIFFANNKPAGIPVSDLEVDHEKQMHVIGIRRDMNEFFHIHPVRSQTTQSSAVPPSAERTSNGVNPEFTASPGIFSAKHIFAKPGNYKVWSQVRQGGVEHLFGHPEFEVMGAGMIEEKNVEYGRTKTVGGYQVSLGMKEPVVKNHEHEIGFDIHPVRSQTQSSAVPLQAERTSNGVHDSAGKEIELENYLGAKMHLAIIKDDWRQFIHIHPVRDAEGDHSGYRVTPLGMLNIDVVAEQISNGVNPERGGGHMSGFPLINIVRAHGGEKEEAPMVHGLNFHAVFPEAGLYKAFAQFLPKEINLPPDETLTASFWIKVEEKAPPAFSGATKWWSLLGISVVLIILLGFGVRGFLRVN